PRVLVRNGLTCGFTQRLWAEFFPIWGVPPLKNRESEAQFGGRLPSDRLSNSYVVFSAQNRGRFASFPGTGHASSGLPSWNSCAPVFMMVLGHVPARLWCNPAGILLAAALP